ncbi:MAG: hypothetical protein Q9177_002657 [Variospora cf. flavescens]
MRYEFTRQPARITREAGPTAQKMKASLVGGGRWEMGDGSQQQGAGAEAVQAGNFHRSRKRLLLGPPDALAMNQLRGFLTTR